MGRSIRALQLLTPAKIKSLTQPGRYSDGGNLYLRMAPNGSKSWTFLYRWHGKPTELGFGSDVHRDLDEGPRKRRRGAPEDRRAGENPKTARESATDATFKAVQRALIGSMATTPGAASGHAQQWAEFPLRSTPNRSPIIRSTRSDRRRSRRPAEALADEARDGLAAARSHRTRPRLRQGRRFWPRGLANPARWRGHLDQMLPKRKKIDRSHHAAMPYDQVPDFVQRLREREASFPVAGVHHPDRRAGRGGDRRSLVGDRPR